MTELIRSIWVDESGQDLAEYSLMLGLILVVVAGTILLIGGHVNTIFSAAETALGNAAGA